MNDEPLFDGILVPLAGTADERTAVLCAAELARRADAPITFVGHIPSWASSHAVDRARSDIELLTADVTVRSHIHLVHHERPVDAVLELAARLPDGVICMPTHARSTIGQLLWGSVALEVARLSPVPMVLVGPCVVPADELGLDEVLVTLDGSPSAERAVGPARRAVRTFGLRLRLLGIAPFSDDARRDEGPWPDERYMATMSDEMYASTPGDLWGGWSLMTATSPASGLAELAASHPEIMMAMATQVRGVGQRFREGSVVVDAVARAAGPVLVVGPACSC